MSFKNKFNVCFCTFNTKKERTITTTTSRLIHQREKQNSFLGKRMWFGKELGLVG